MRIEHFSADGFRNLENIDIDLHPELNVICGQNAQGKTNILEAIWLCTGERSFRGAKDRELIRLGGERFDIGLRFADKRRTQQIDYTLIRSEIRSKKIALNGVSVKNPSGLFGALECVVFTPEDLELSKGSPEVRRSFADLSVSQIKRSYRRVVDKYRRLLEQRNTQLKAAYQTADIGDMLEIWDIQLAQMGAYISMLRYNYCKKLEMAAQKLYSEISQGRERLEIEYHSTIYENLQGRTDYRNDLAAEYAEALKKSRAEDMRAGFTLKGVHRDDLHCKINGMYAKDYASQGQHRSIALIMKLAQAYILSEETGDAPCILLDDVMSELDAGRQEFVMSKIRDMQVIITCCGEEALRGRAAGGKVIKINSGRVI